MTGYSYSALGTYRDCRRKFNYRYARRLETLGGPAVELDMGTWWHAIKAVDSIQRGAAKGSLRFVPEYLELPGDVKLTTRTKTPPTVRDVLKAASKYWRTLDDERKADYIETFGEPLVSRLIYMHTDWLNRWGKDIEHESPLAVELPWEIQLEGITLRGRVDEVYRDEKRGLTVVRDYKTGKSITRNSSSLDDMMDSQLQFYVVGVAPQLERWGVKPVGAVSYDRMRTTAPKTPQLTLSGTLSKSVTDFNERAYRDFVGCDGVSFEGRKKDGSGAGVYQLDEKVIEELRTPTALAKWADRTLTPVNPSLIREHLAAAKATALEIASLTEDGRNARSLTRSCGWCDFASLCRAELFGGEQIDTDLAEFGLYIRR